MDHTLSDVGGIQPALLVSPGDLGLADFDYGTFIPDQDIDYLAEESAASNHTLSDGSSHLASESRALAQRPRSDGSPGTSPTMQAPRQRLERRGHTKSRRGCYNCKRRRIKVRIFFSFSRAMLTTFQCQETRPACGHCTKTGLKCEYPTLPQVVHQVCHPFPSPNIISNPI